MAKKIRISSKKPNPKRKLRESNEPLLTAEEETKSSSDASNAPLSTQSSENSLENQNAPSSDTPSESSKAKSKNPPAAKSSGKTIQAPEGPETSPQSKRAKGNSNTPLRTNPTRESEKQPLQDESPQGESNVPLNTTGSSNPRMEEVLHKDADSDSTPANQTGGNQNEDVEDEDEDDDPENLALKRIRQTGEDECPNLVMDQFGDHLLSLSPFEEENKEIYEKILDMTTRLPMSKGRFLNELLVAHRVYKKTDFQLEDFLQHERDCEFAEEHGDTGRDQFRGILFLQEFKGLNPLTGAAYDTLLEVAEVFVAQDEFFSTGDCCITTWLQNRAIVALQIAMELIADACPQAAHKRKFWSYVQRFPYLLHDLEPWTDLFMVPETRTEADTRLARERYIRASEYVDKQQRRVETQEKHLVQIANELAQSQIPRNLTGVTHPDDELVYDHVTKAMVPHRVLRDRASKGYQQKLFRDEKRKHHQEQRAKRAAAQAANMPQREIRPHTLDTLRQGLNIPRDKGTTATGTAGGASQTAPPQSTQQKDPPTSNQQPEEDLPLDYDDYGGDDLFDGNDGALSPITKENDFDRSVLQGKEKGTDVIVNPSLMVSLVAIPETETFIPGDKSFTEVYNFVHQCENLGQKLRIMQWPQKLRSAIDFQYRYTYELFDGNSDAKDSDWQVMDASQLRTVLDRMRDAVQEQSSSSTDLVEGFRTWLSTNRLQIDWGRPEGPLTHPFAKDVNDIRNRYANILTQMDIPKLDDNKGQLLVKLLKKEIVHKNISTEGRAQMKSAMEGGLHNISDFNTALTVVSDIVMKQLMLLQKVQAFKGDATTSMKRKDSSGSAEHPKAKTSKKQHPSSTSSGPSKSSSGAPRLRCRGCGWDLKQKEGKGPPICPRNDYKGCKGDKRRNFSKKNWQDSDVGKKWAKFTTRGLPKNPDITLDNAHEVYTKGKGDNK